MNKREKNGLSENKKLKSEYTGTLQLVKRSLSQNGFQFASYSCTHTPSSEYM